ncbi:MAG: A/G-specific adenine glycosylase [Pseudomonadota bacterium]
MDFADRLLAWYRDHGRHDLPWQQPRTPYRVWLSEIMLQQTQVTTVIPYFERFVADYPDVHALAGASEDDVLHRWSGLGYYARARNLRKAAIIVSNEFAGEFPRNIDDLTALPGIGRSTAGAILALGYGIRAPILDGNVKRVLARFHAIDGWPGRTATLQRLWDEAERATPAADTVTDYTQAIMDLGATLCTRTKPLCPVCPQRVHCIAHQRGRELDYPGKKPRKAKPQRATTMLLAEHGGSVLLARRDSSGLWGGLWSLPEIADEAGVAEWVSEFGAGIAATEPWSPLKHSFSHYELTIHPLRVRLDRKPVRVAEQDKTLWYKLDAPADVGLAAPVARLIDELRTRVVAAP